MTNHWKEAPRPGQQRRGPTSGGKCIFHVNRVQKVREFGRNLFSCFSLMPHLFSDINNDTVNQSTPLQVTGGERWLLTHTKTHQGFLLKQSSSLRLRGRYLLSGYYYYFCFTVERRCDMDISKLA